MKMNRIARKISKFRVTAICLTIALLAGIEFAAGESLAARIGQTTSRQTESPQAPNVSLADVMGAMR
ncbi:MAG: hypothetical protein NTW03_14355 [Verrucomicrobia bacterium]|nr:hypothetical protein [Verrucomicrobiota bacterium]